MKKRLCLWLAVCLLSGLFGILPVFAEVLPVFANVIDQGICGGEGDGGNLTWTLDSERTLTISGTGEMAGWSHNRTPWYSHTSSIKKAVISQGITSIGDYAFSSCTQLVQVHIGNDVTAIGENAFSDCTSLTAVAIPDGVASIEASVFRNCYNLTQAVIPDSVTSIGIFAFANCYNLTQIAIPDSVTSIEYNAFFGCKGLLSVTVPDSGVSIGSDAFSGCASLTQAVLPDSVASIGARAFAGTALRENKDNWQDGLLYIGSHLIEADNDAISPVCAPRPGTKCIAGAAFSECGNLTDILIPDGVTSIGELAFYRCANLTNAAIPGSVAAIEADAFFGCPSLSGVALADGMASIGFGAFSSCPSLTQIAIPGSVVSIGQSAFAHCENLARIRIADGVTAIGVDAFADTAYYNDQSRWADGALYIDNHLIKANELEISPAYTVRPGTRTIADRAFSYCEYLTVVNLPDSLTAIGKGAFEDCYRLTAVSIPDGVASIEAEAFSRDESLTSLSIGSGVTSIERWAFSSCNMMTAVNIPVGVTWIDAYAFFGCSSLADVYYGGSEAQWQAIRIRSNNTPLTDANIHYNCEMPTLAQSITLDKTSFTVRIGEAAQEDLILTASILPANAFNQTVTWTSSNPEAVTVRNGKLTLHKPGDAIITAVTTNARSAVCRVRVLSDVYITRLDVSPGAEGMAEVTLETAGVEDGTPVLIAAYDSQNILLALVQTAIEQSRAAADISVRGAAWVRAYVWEADSLRPLTEPGENR